ncbi:MAG: aminoglycoside phosphotransferase family protein [Bacteroidetes bacterium]|nr:aminoglycoside phosphotransferase family protein [Bacteroidota bacterium]
MSTSPLFNNYLQKLTGANSCHQTQIIQTLWSGYGKIARYKLQGVEIDSVVVKEIKLQKANQHPRGWNTNVGHERKVKSYEVETHWYKEWSEQCNEQCRIPKLLGSYTEDGKQWLVLEDLIVEFPERKVDLCPEQAKVCLKWLANFHAQFLGKHPQDLWPIGTYWHLQTRQEEWERMQASELKEKARAIDNRLNQCQYKTILHGDAKVANFCFSKLGDRVAAVDFQYTGAGCGMKDMAYFLGSCLSSDECFRFESELLDNYFQQLKKALINSSTSTQLECLESEWRALYSFAIADFTRFLLGWMPSHQKVNEYHLSITNNVLAHI